MFFILNLYTPLLVVISEGLICALLCYSVHHQPSIPRVYLFSTGQ